VAFVSVYTIEGEQATGQLRVLRVRGLRIVRHFHLIHHARRRLSTAARAFMEAFAAAAPARPTRRAGARARSR
jgi:DNA-binding transcriptional LysR family regulator